MGSSKSISQPRLRQTAKASSNSQGFVKQPRLQTAKASHSRGGGARALHRLYPPGVRGRREDRAPAGAHGPRAEKKHAAEPQAQPRIPGLPCAVVLRLTPRSPRGPGFFAPVIPKARVARFGSLAPASGRQDHTAWPFAKRSFVRILEKNTAISRVHRCPPPRP
jgi:hypothetical protein